jgi:hypothetical protein
VRTEDGFVGEKAYDAAVILDVSENINRNKRQKQILTAAAAQSSLLTEH